MTTAHGDDEPTRRLTGIVYGTRFEGFLPPAFAHHLRPMGSGREPCRRTVTVTYRPISREQVLAEAGDLAAETEVQAGMQDGMQAGVETAPEGCLWQSEAGGITSPGRFTLAGRREHFRLAAWGPQQGLFEIRPERIDLAWAGGIGDGGAGAAHHLFAYAVPLWLETRGIPVLHGSAVTLGGRAVGFLGPSGTGKSVLCAELVRLGAGFLADDGLALEPTTVPTVDPAAERNPPPPGVGGAAWRCLAGPPLLRLWPSGLARRLDLAPEDLPKIRPQGDKRQLAAEHLGSGDKASEKAGDTAEGPAGDSDRPTLGALYLLRRRREAGGGVELSPQSPRQALFRLVEHGVAASPAAALGLEESRLQTLARVAETVPFRELSFPTGADSAAAVADALERDLHRLGG